MKQFEYETTLNGGVVSVYLKVTTEDDECGTRELVDLDSVFFDCTNVTAILSKEQLSELEMEAEAAFYGSDE